MLGHRMFPLVLAFLAAFAHGQVYTWVDESGQKHFSSQPPVTQPNIEPVKINHGYIGEGNVAPPPLPSFSTSSNPPKGSKKQMCTSAIRWTAEDIENLKDIAKEQMQAKKISAADYAEGQKNFKGIEERITFQNCITSSGMDEKRYRCLSEGLGLIVCSGLAEEAIREGMSRAQRR